MKASWLEKLEKKEKMANHSTNSKHIITTKSGHEIHLDEPELVINAIKEVTKAVRTGKPLKTRTLIFLGIYLYPNDGSHNTCSLVRQSNR